MYRRKKKKSHATLGCIVVVVALVLLAGLGYLTYSLIAGGPAEQQVAASQNSAIVDARDSDRAKMVQETGEKNSQAVKKKPEGKDIDTQEPYSILIKKSEFKLYVKKGEQIVETFGCALGKNKGDKAKRNDMKTPEGTFVVDEICDAHSWSHDFNDGKGVIEHAYGPWFFSLDTREKSKGQWDGIGIHGTHDPSSIGTLASEGCIRLENQYVEKLKQQYIKVGTKVTIEE